MNQKIADKSDVNALTDYENRILAEMERWLSQRSSFPGEAMKLATEPFAQLTKRILPDQFLENSFKKAEGLVQKSSHIQAFLNVAEVSSVYELRSRSLEYCDRLAQKYSVRAERAAMIDGLVAGLGGTVTEILNLPILVAAALRTICLIGHSYGYELLGHHAKEYVLAILNLAAVDEPGRRQELFLEVIRIETDSESSEVTDNDVDQNFKHYLTTDVEILLIEQITLESIPVAGDLISIVLSYDFMHHVDLTARHVFQERRLRESGKIQTIQPLSQHKRRSAIRQGWEASSQIGYMLGYSVGYSTTFPLSYVAGWFQIWKTH